MAGSPGTFRFKRRERIIDPQDFRRVMRFGKKSLSRNFILFSKANDKGCHRLGVVISKDVGKATYRTRVKRLVREFFRLNKPRMDGTWDAVVLVRKGITSNRYGDVEEELRRLFAR